MANGNKPEKKFRAGAVTATVWKNTGKINGKETEYHTVSLERNYKDKDGNWQSTGSMRVNDMPNAQLVLSKTYEYLQLKDVTQGNGNDSIPEEEIM